jgi:hypothetical protein
MGIFLGKDGLDEAWGLDDFFGMCESFLVNACGIVLIAGGEEI